MHHMAAPSRELEPAVVLSEDDVSIGEPGEPQLNGEMISSSDGDPVDGTSGTQKLDSEDGAEEVGTKRTWLSSPLTKSDNSDCELDSSPDAGGNGVSAGSGEGEQTVNKDTDEKYIHDDDDWSVVMSSGDEGEQETSDNEVEEVKDEDAEDHDPDDISSDSGGEQDASNGTGSQLWEGSQAVILALARLSGETMRDSGVVADEGAESDSGAGGDDLEPMPLIDSDKEDNETEEATEDVEKGSLSRKEGAQDSSVNVATSRKTRSEKLTGERQEESDDDIIEEKLVEKNEPMKHSSVTRKQDDDPDVQAVDPVDPLADPREVPDVQAPVDPLADPVVIVDTNSILSGKGPVPVNLGMSTTSTTTLPPTSLPSQSICRIRNIPIHTGSGLTAGGTNQRQSSSATSMSVKVTHEWPGLSDDMFVVESPSFIVPYVYEKPPKESVKEFCSRLEKSGKGEEEKKGESSQAEKDKAEDDKVTDKEERKNKLLYPHDNFFDSSLGKFFIQTGMNLVQEYVQTDLLRAVKRKAEREREKTSAATQHAISSLLRNLEDSKENNEPFHFETKKCEFCNFKTESTLVMARHLETPHMRLYTYRCNFCPFETRSPHDILFHMEAEHNVRGHLERAPAFHQCVNCSFEDNSKIKLSRHILSCMKKFRHDWTQEPITSHRELPAKIYHVSQGHPATLGPRFAPIKPTPATMAHPLMSKQAPAPVRFTPAPTLIPLRGRPPGPATLASKLGVDARTLPSRSLSSASHIRPGMIYRPPWSQVHVPSSFAFKNNSIYPVVNRPGHMVPVMTGGPINVPRLALMPSGVGGSGGGGAHVPMALIPNLTSGAISITIQSALNRTILPKAPQQPSISITPLPRQTAAAPVSLSSIAQGSSPKATTPSSSAPRPKTTLVICEICDGYIKGLEQLRTHMQWVHKVKIHPKMLYKRPPLNCQKCQYRYFTDQGLERHLLGSHGLVTSSMQEAANKEQDGGRCPVCRKEYQRKLLNHVAKDHNLTLKPAYLSYKCTLCTATFGMYKQFEYHVYSTHNALAKPGDKKGGDVKFMPTSSSAQHLLSQSQSLLKPLKITDEITIIPQPVKSSPTPSSTASTAITGESSRSTSLVQGQQEVEVSGW